MLIIVSGPSGVGKTRLVEMATESLGLNTFVPYTTRQRRPNEDEGRDYYYVSKGKFREMIRGGEFFDWDYTLQNYYGCPWAVKAIAEESTPAIIHALARMAIRISMRLPNVVLVFLHPHSEATLSERLALRSYSDEELVLRQEHWREETEHASMFDIVVEGAEVISSDHTIGLLQDIIVQRGVE